jgi:bifunctional non-homologous end joining protein LigD
MTIAWRVRAPARGGARLPAGFILPSQPTLAPVAPSGPGWSHELKHDGWRLIARKDADGVRLWTRQATDVTRRFTGIAAAVAALPGDGLVLDGEAVIFRPDGHSDFHGLLSPGQGSEAVMVAFDLLLAGSTDLRQASIENRRGRREDLVQRHGHSSIVFSQSIEGEGPMIFEHACRLGAEGIISKRRGSICRSGRVDGWRKTKFAGFVRP